MEPGDLRSAIWYVTSSVIDLPHVLDQIASPSWPQFANMGIIVCSHSNKMLWDLQMKSIHYASTRVIPMGLKLFINISLVLLVAFVAALCSGVQSSSTFCNVADFDIQTFFIEALLWWTKINSPAWCHTESTDAVIPWYLHSRDSFFQS